MWRARPDTSHTTAGRGFGSCSCGSCSRAQWARTRSPLSCCRCSRSCGCRCLHCSWSFRLWGGLWLLCWWQSRGCVRCRGVWTVWSCPRRRALRRLPGGHSRRGVSWCRARRWDRLQRRSLYEWAKFESLLNIDIEWLHHELVFQMTTQSWWVMYS